MMEVDSMPGDDGPPPLSPQQKLAPSDKVVEADDSLGYTITMNDCDDDSNESSSASPSLTTAASAEQDSPNPDIQPPKLRSMKSVENGNRTSKQSNPDPGDDKETGKSAKDTADKSARRTPDVNGVSLEEEDGEEMAEKNRGKVEEPHDQKAAVKKNEGSRETGAESSKETTPSKAGTVEKSRTDENSGQADRRVVDKEKKSDSAGSIDLHDKKGNDALQVKDKKENAAEKENSKKPAASRTSPGMDASASCSARLALAGKLASASNLAPKSNAVLVDAKTVVSYVPASGTTSLLTTTPGVQLLLPSGAAGQVMYIPSSGAFLTSTTPRFQGATTSRVSLGSSTNPILIPAINARSTPAASSQSYIVSGSGGLAAGVIRPPYVPPQPPAPPPTFASSSKGMIDMIKWECENHINVKPKYVKSNPKAELGNLAKWIFDLGSDLVKEFVYHDLVKLHCRRKDDDSLSQKEKSDFKKLQEIDEDLNKKIGHLKYKLTKSCKCGFRSDLASVLYLHKEYAHHDRGGLLNCGICKFSTRQPGAFKFHMEAEHSMCGRVDNRPCFFECALCPYESNYPNRLDQHKVRCLKQFRPAVNLHPSCLTGPEVNLCLENVFYFVFTRQFLNSIMPPKTNSGPTSTSVTTTNYKDLKPKTVSQSLASIQSGSSLVGKFNASATGNRASITAQAYGGRNSIVTVPSSTKQFPALSASAVSRNFPVISSQIGGKAVTSTATAPVVNAATAKQQPTVSQQPNVGNNAFEVCEICGGYVKDRKALRIHFFYAHRIDMPFGVFERSQPPLYCATCFARFWTAQGLQKHIEVHKADLTGTNSVGNGVAGKCISCGHRVPNILMHMRMVHNRELRHYLAALMCIFCGNRFSSKIEVENHMGSQHGVVVKNSAASGINVTQGQKQAPAVPSNPPNQRALQNNAAPKQPSLAPLAPKPKPGGSKLNRGSQCVLCNLTFARNVDLTRHCMRVHHTCMKCGLVVVDKESLNRHTCLHSAAGMRTCQICGEQGFHPAYYIKHMRDKHLRRCSVVLRRIDRATVETFKRPITISDSDDDDDDVQPIQKPPSPKRQKVQGVQENLPSKSKAVTNEKTEAKGEKSMDKKEQKLDNEKEPKSDKKGEPVLENKDVKSGDEGKKESVDDNSQDTVSRRNLRTKSPKEDKSASENARKSRDSEKKQASGVPNSKEVVDKKMKKTEEENSDSAGKSAASETLNDGVSQGDKQDSSDNKKVETGCSDKSPKSADKNKGKNDRKRKSDGSSDNESNDEVPYSKKLRRSSRTNSDVLELD